MQDEGGYVCDFCEEEIVLRIDLSAGSGQDCVEDYPAGRLMAQNLRASSGCAPTRHLNKQSLAGVL